MDGAIYLKECYMKLYTKSINGQTHVMPVNKIVIIKDDMQAFNPTEEMLLEEGWAVYIQTFTEVCDEHMLEQEINNIIEEILLYDSSNQVNMFYVNDIPIWLDKATRVGLMLRFNAEREINKTETTLWYNGMSFSLNLLEAIKMLNAIELYASECYDNTQKHIATIKSIKSINELKQYDYTTGYPEKLRF